jgi:hypothetical protein
VRKTPCCEPFILIKRSFYQYRLGTNIGKALKKRAMRFLILIEIESGDKSRVLKAGSFFGERELFFSVKETRLSFAMPFDSY